MMELLFRLMFGSDFKSYTAVNTAPLPSTPEWYEEGDCFKWKDCHENLWPKKEA
jgi:hypothetical protein